LVKIGTHSFISFAIFDFSNKTQQLYALSIYQANLSYHTNSFNHIMHHNGLRELNLVKEQQTVFKHRGTRGRYILAFLYIITQNI